MRSPHAFRNGESPTSWERTHFHSTVAAQKLHRFNSLILLLRLASFSFSLASAVFMLTNSRGSGSPHWYDFDNGGESKIHWKHLLRNSFVQSDQRRLSLTLHRNTSGPHFLGDFSILMGIDLESLTTIFGTNRQKYDEWLQRL